MAEGEDFRSPARSGQVNVVYIMIFDSRYGALYEGYYLLAPVVWDSSVR